MFGNEAALTPTLSRAREGERPAQREGEGPAQREGEGRMRKPKGR
jgi:hypothetical protein